MGLDMYLFRETYVGGQWENRDVKGTVELTYNGTMDPDNYVEKSINVDLKNLVSLTEQLMYWRKANAIHGWFVSKVQKGEDDCAEYLVRRSDLEELWQICNEIMNVEDKEQQKELAMKLLPPVGGFFSGTTELDEWYFSDLRRTEEVLRKELDKPANFEISYKYQSSW